MPTPIDPPQLLIIRGNLGHEELAALTVVLMARSVLLSDSEPVEPVALWQRFERNPRYHSPVSWQSAA